MANFILSLIMKHVTFMRENVCLFLYLYRVVLIALKKSLNNFIFDEVKLIPKKISLRNAKGIWRIGT